MLSSEAERRETVDPVSDGLRGTTRVDGRRPLPVTDVQLFGILITHRLWKLRLQPTMVNKVRRNRLKMLSNTECLSLYKMILSYIYIQTFVSLQPLNFQVERIGVKQFYSNSDS